MSLRLHVEKRWKFCLCVVFFNYLHLNAVQLQRENRKNALDVRIDGIYTHLYSKLTALKCVTGGRAEAMPENGISFKVAFAMAKIDPS